MRDDYLQEALKVIEDPNILVNVVSRRVKQLRRGHRALVESLEKLSAEDVALREIIERKIKLRAPDRRRAGDDVSGIAVAGVADPTGSDNVADDVPDRGQRPRLQQSAS